MHNKLHVHIFSSRDVFSFTEGSQKTLTYLIGKRGFVRRREGGRRDKIYIYPAGFRKLKLPDDRAGVRKVVGQKLL